MAKYLSIAGARHLIDKCKENFVSAQSPVQVAYSTNAGYSDTAGSANKANQATNDAAGNPIHSTYLTINDAADIYLKKNDNAVSSTKALTAETCTGNAENSTRLATPRKINVTDATELNFGTAANFDGTSDVKIKLPPTIKATLDGNSATATKATSDSNGNIITNHYAPNYNPVFTGTPQAPTANDGTNNNQLATTAFVQTAIKNLIGTAPETLDTLNELAEAINQDKNFASTMANALANKQDLNSALSSISNLVTSADKMIFTNAPNSYVTTTLTNFARTLLDDSDAEIARQTLNALGQNENSISATKLLNAREISITDGTNTGTPSNFDGTKNISLKLPATIKANLNGNADSATNSNFATKAQQDDEGNIISKIYAPLTNPILKGIPQAPTADKNISTDQIATTKFVSTAIENFKNEKILNAINSDFSTQAQQDAEGNIITQKYLPKISSTALKIPVDNWIDDGDKPFNLYRDFPIDCLTAADVVNINISPNHQGLCVDCGLCPTCEIFDGKIRLRSKEVPTAEISAEFYILKGASQGKEKAFGSVNCSTSLRVIIYKVPEQVGTLTFNKKIQTPIWDDYDPTKLLMTGEISGVDADTYTVSFIPIGNCTWSDDTRTPKSQTWKINRAVIFKIPSQKNILTFNGTPQTPTLENFNPEEIILSGDFENKTDAGAYIAYATPTSNFMFSDNSTDSKFFLWTINKAAQIIELDKNYLSLENILMSDTVKINRLGDGKISATSSDENVVTVENVDCEVKVSAVATGNATITINVAESKNYLAASINLPVESFVIKPLEQCTPAEIVDAIQSGKAINAWDVGDLTAPIILNGKIGDALTLDNFQVRAKLIGFNHNSELESDGKISAHFIFETALIDENYNLASANGTKYLRKYF